jgi:hypothetical protein
MDYGQEDRNTFFSVFWDNSLSSLDISLVPISEIEACNFKGQFKSTADPGDNFKDTA